jgi:hypothetical protein
MMTGAAKGILVIVVGFVVLLVAVGLADDLAPARESDAPLGARAPRHPGVRHGPAAGPKPISRSTCTPGWSSETTATPAG